MYQQKRGQITVFIVIGIVLLLGIGITFFLLNTFQKEKIGIELKKDAAEGDAKLVQDYLNSCLEALGKEAIIQIGLHGGYINLSDNIATNREFIINPVDQTNSDAVLLGENAIPYWWYMQTSNKCVQCSVTRKNIPSIGEMEEQINGYVTRKLPECLADFTGLKEQGIAVAEQQKPIIETSITDSVYLQITYPLAIQSAKMTHLEKSYVVIPVPLKKIYNAAFDLVEQEIKQRYLEKAMLNIISLYAGLDENKLPPFAGITLTYELVYWTKPTVKKLLQSYVQTYIPLFTINKTKETTEISTGNPLEEGFYKNFIIDLQEPADDLEINHLYQQQDIYLDITPSRGALLGPAVFKNSFPLNVAPTVQTNVYEFFYDLSFPVVVAVRNPEAFAGSGYTFFVAIEGNIRDNLDLYHWSIGEGTFGPWNPNSVTFALNEDARQYPVGVINNTNKTAYAEFKPPAKSLLCMDEQKLSGEISVTSYDALTQESLPFVGLTFSCGKYRSCALTATNKHGSSKEKLPLCEGGIITLEKEGYYPTIFSLDTKQNKKEIVVGYLEPFRALDASVQLISTTRLNGSYSTASLQALNFDMKTTDTAVITIERIKQTSFDSSYTQVLFINGTNAQELNIVPGEYTIQSIYMKNDGVVIPEKTETISGKKITYPEIEMNPAMLGGAYIDQRSRTWNLTTAMLTNKQKVEFYLWRMQDPDNISDLEEMGQFENYSISFRDALEPKLS